ncbi:MAG: hypothetical protein A3G25_16170 [Betaproteobacteria bacterium RIFCSPLOWO2_12_FULL_63_13]|nr:MAG: hypothetical protein A3G25_16170 [Betaproteobacteria bacterium RIFCSPLOWO2_12_FULL_63_13]
MVRGNGPQTAPNQSLVREAVLLRPRPRLPRGERLRAILQGLPDDPTFKRPEQPPLEREAQWRAEHGFEPMPAARRRRSRAKR